MPEAASLPPAVARHSAARILETGRNCWRVEHATRFAMLVDGEQYFAAVREALRTARQSVFILGWDIDSRMRLVPDGASDGWPEPFGEFLNALVKARKGLRAYVLTWDFAMLYMPQREWLPIFKLDMLTHRRLSFHMDSRHPVGGSHHQKVVVVDDSVAFVSGFDITRSRWDSPEHARADPRRRNPFNLGYGPIHDVGAVVEGPCARALGELARARWLHATERRAAVALAKPSAGHWPASTVPDLTDVPVAIARTEPRFEDFDGAAEILQLHLDAIAAAKRHVYAENQYFTSRTIADALAGRLAEPGGPEIAVVSPRIQSGWLEASTMGVLRGRLDAMLRAADREGRYRLLCPRVPWLDDEGSCLNVHSKVLIVDDALALIGSANLSNRSMGLDTECGLAVEAAGDGRIGRAIAGLRHRLLAEHLATTSSRVRQAERESGSLLRAIDALHDPEGRTLAAFEAHPDPALDAIVPDASVVDPEQPADADALVDDLVRQPEVRLGARRRVAIVVLIVAVLAALAVAWRTTPLGEWLSLDRLAALTSAAEARALAPLGAIAAFVVGGLLLVPVTLLIGVAVLVFGPVEGALLALAGATASAATTYALGRALGRDVVRNLAGRRINVLSQRLAKRGLLAVTLVRLVPIAPFSVVNAVAGASHIGWRDFLLGTALGLAPGLVLTSAIVDRALAVARDPGPVTAASLAVIAAIAIGVIRWLRRRLALHRRPAPSDGKHAG